MEKKALKKFDGSPEGKAAVQAREQSAVARLPPRSGRATVQALFERSSPEISKALAGQMQTDRFIRAAMTAYANGSSYFQKAEPVSLLAACMQAAQLGLSVDPVLGEAWLIPRRNSARNCVWINFQLGYKGLVKLARRSTNFLSVHAELVHDGDFFEYDLGSDPKISHRKQMDLKTRPDVKASYAVVRYKTGPAQIHVSPLWEIHEARERSDSYQNGRGPWIDHFNSMAKVVPTRAILKLEAVDDVVLRQLGREDAQEGSPDVIEIGLDGELALPTAEFESLPEATIEHPESIDDLKKKFGSKPEIPDEPA